jgi:hypothetical protein
LALDTTLLGLLAAQRYRQAGGVVSLGCCLAAVCLAPLWFASGILAGPLCSLYLLWGAWKSGWPRRLSGAVPLLGVALFFLMLTLLPRSWDRVVHAAHYGDKTALESFDVGTGLFNTLRGVVDGLFFGLVGVSGVTCPPPWLAAVVLVPLAGVAWWCRRAAGWRLVVLGLALIVLPYLLVFSARADWDYDDVMMFTPSWSRYHLFPQAGLTLLLCAGLQGRLGDAAGLGGKQSRFLAAGIGLLFLVQLPRSLLFMTPFDPTQGDTLRSIDVTDTLCREHGVSAALARQALKPLAIPECPPWVNGWEFLRGSDRPRPLSVAEARELLGGHGTTRQP